MSEQEADNMGEERVRLALAGMLDGAEPRGNLWPAIQLAAQPQEVKSGRRWFRPILVPAAVLGSIAVALVMLSSIASPPRELAVGDATTDLAASGMFALAADIGSFSDDTSGVSASEKAIITDASGSGRTRAVELLYALAAASAADQLTAKEIEAIVAAAAAKGATGTPVPAPPAPDDTTTFQDYGVNPFVDTRDDHLSTFAMDVDTASYTIARLFLSGGRLPPAESVRVEEFINYFDQQYPAPTKGAFEISVEGAPSPFGDAGLQLLRVGIQGRVVGVGERKDASLVLVIDISGSMREGNRLELVKDSVRILLDELGPGDEIGIVTYSSRAQNLLEPTGVENNDAILGALQGLTPQRSTNVEEGLQFGYHMAQQMNRPGRITRVVLLSDGVANVGNVEAESILGKVRSYLDEGITISTVGVGMGNFNDVLLERLANDGNGNYVYIDTLAEARRIFADKIVGTLQVIARDAKVQVDFNPDVIQRYRLLGYENREIADEDFRNDAVDAGEVGAGHSVTALYEVLLHEDARGPIAIVSVRYEDPDSGEVSEVERSFHSDDLKTATMDTSPRFLLTAAVAEFAEILRGSPWSEGSRVTDALALARTAFALLPDDPDVPELLRILEQAERIVQR
jgi:Ca-activated chloride channel homolog